MKFKKRKHEKYKIIFVAFAVSLFLICVNQHLIVKLVYFYHADKYQMAPQALLDYPIFDSYISADYKSCSGLGNQVTLGFKKRR